MQWYLTALRNYATFDGRAGLREYWNFVFFNILVAVLLRILDHMGGTVSAMSGYGLLGGLYTLFVVTPGLAVTIRRLHDSNLSGMWLGIILIPLVGFFIVLALCLRVSAIGTNRFGSPPSAVPV